MTGSTPKWWVAPSALLLAAVGVQSFNPPAAPPPPFVAPTASCIDDHNDEILAAAWFHCYENPYYKNLTNSTGCCPVSNPTGKIVSYPGTCNKCTEVPEEKFTCTPPMDVTQSSFSLSWGFFVALLADISISVGLALQKLANTRIQHRAKLRGGGDVPAEPSLTDLISEPAWLIGICVTVGSEIGDARNLRTHTSERPLGRDVRL